MSGAKVLTLIIPTYNMEAYLPRCLDSLMPVAEEGDLEVVVVNDGSTDRSLEIAEDYRLRLPGAIVVVSKENGGYGSGVNAGLKVATGRYVKLLDADDWMDTSALRKVVTTLRDMEDVDLVIAPFNVQFPDGKSTTRGVRLPTGKVLSAAEYWRNKTILNRAHQYFMYRRAMLAAVGYKQLEHCLYTDTQWSFSPLAGVRSIYAFAEPLYQYRVGRPGQSVDIAVRRQKFADEVRTAEATTRDFAGSQFASAAIRKCMEAKLEAQVLRLFKMSVVLGFGDAEGMERLDESLRRLAPTVWKSLGRKTISRFLPIRFICRWRKNHMDPLLRLGVRIHGAFHKE